MYYLYLLLRSSDSRHKLNFLELGKRMHLSYEAGASRSRVTKHRDFYVFFCLHFSCISGTLQGPERAQCSNVQKVLWNQKIRCWHTHTQTQPCSWVCQWRCGWSPSTASIYMQRSLNFCVGEQNRNQGWKKELLVTVDSSEFWTVPWWWKKSQKLTYWFNLVVWFFTQIPSFGHSSLYLIKQIELFKLQ